MEQDRVKDRILARASRVLAGTLQAGLLASGLTLGSSPALAQAAASATSSVAIDSQLQSAVTAALAGDAVLRGQQVAATVAQGAVTLSGTVADDSQRLAAEQTVAQVAGVRSIEDSLSVGNQNSSAPQTAQSDNAPPPENSPMNAQSGAPNMPPPPPNDATQQNGPQQQGQAPYGPSQYSQQGQNQGQNQGQYQGQYPGDPRGQYAPPPQRPYVAGVSPEKQNASGPVTLAPGLLLNVRTSEPLSTGRLKSGEFVQFTAASDVYANGVVAVPRGAVITGQVVEAKNAGPFGGSPKLDLKLTTILLGSQTYPVASDVWSSQGPSKTGYTAANTVGGAAFGALIGAVAGGGVGAGIGAAAGGAGGLLVSGATHGPRLDLPAEALLQFHLAAPLTVQPVNYNEAERLAASVPQQPVLRQRPMYVRSPYPYYPRPYYAYPAPYYYRAY